MCFVCVCLPDGDGREYKQRMEGASWVFVFHVSSLYALLPSNNVSVVDFFFSSLYFSRESQKLRAWLVFLNSRRRDKEKNLFKKIFFNFLFFRRLSIILFDDESDENGDGADYPKGFTFIRNAHPHEFSYPLINTMGKIANTHNNTKNNRLVRVIFFF